MPLKIEYVPVGKIQPHPENPRRGDVDIIRESVKANGVYRPLIVQKSSGYILAGNHTYQALVAEGIERVPVVFLDVDDVGAKRIMLADNRTSDFGDYDDAQLMELLQALDGDLVGTGWDDDDLSELLAGGGSQMLTNPNDVPPIPSTPITKTGQLWLLGKHRVLCGDSTKPEDVARLLDGKLADMLLTDPPYNVALGSHMRPSEAKQLRRRADGLVIENDSWESAAEFIEFLKKAFSSALAGIKPGAVFYIWYATSQEMNFHQACAEANMQVRQVLVWNKNVFVLGRQDYQWKHEPCLYGWKEGAAHNWYSDRKQTTVLDFDKPQRSEDHPTMKPVELMAYLIENSSRPGGLVLDSFGGSGSTMIACEQTGRSCVTMELDPHYVDVICRRFQEVTGVVPVDAASGREVSFVLEEV